MATPKRYSAGEAVSLLEESDSSGSCVNLLDPENDSCDSDEDTVAVVPALSTLDAVVSSTHRKLVPILVCDELLSYYTHLPVTVFPFTFSYHLCLTVCLCIYIAKIYSAHIFL